MTQVSLFAAAITIDGLNVLMALGAALLGILLRPKLTDAVAALQRSLDVRRRVATLARREEAAEAALPSSDIERKGRTPGPSEALGNLARDPIRGPRIYASSVAAKDFRCFADMTVDLHHPGDGSKLRYPNVNLVIGDNGAGKSTLLKAIAIAALGPILDSSGFVPYHLIRSRRERSEVRGDFLIDDRHGIPAQLTGAVDVVRNGDYEEVVSRHDRGAWADLFDESDATFLVIGYGVNRRVAEDESERTFLERGRRRRRYQRVAGLFDQDAVLVPLASWLPTLRPRRRAEVETLLNKLLPKEANLAERRRADDVFECRGQEVPYSALSDGYRSFIGWIGDLLCQIDSAAGESTPLDQVGGIVLVDEVDLLLHPSWQREVVPLIAETFPNLQFVFTTHSPIVAGTLQAGNILISRVDELGRSTLVRIAASIHGLNAEQILLSSYFELESTRAVETQTGLGELAERAMQGDDEAAVRYLQILAAGAERREASE
jgi:hypothetical protein